ncbi:hypothetical protein P7K49_023604 [Saguinus oedipus]|uniref:Uncharacterized protein n=1 Tax=Saguinus oedipus TaxID=9490 RepID=A0ABQ9UNR0_SAGOE|nr:hypothetical protein P7K49_023604 [Saguinus oedipus]
MRSPCGNHSESKSMRLRSRLCIKDPSFMGQGLQEQLSQIHTEKSCIQGEGSMATWHHVSISQGKPRGEAELGLADAGLQGELRNESGLGVSLHGVPSGDPGVLMWGLSLSWAVRPGSSPMEGEEEDSAMSFSSAGDQFFEPSDEEQLQSQHALLLRRKIQS